MRKKSVLYSPRLQEIKNKKHKALRKKIIFSLVLCILLLTGLVLMLKWQKINIQSVTVTGNKVIDTDLIKKVAEDNLSGNYFIILPKTNFIFYPKTKIEKELVSKYQRLKDITLGVDNFKNLNIRVAERTAAYTWCGEIPTEVNANTEDKCYFIDEDGYIFDEAPYFSGEVYFKFYGNMGVNTNNPAGSYFAKDIFTKLTNLNKTFKKIGLKTTTLTLVGDGEIRMTLSPQSKNGTKPEIIFNTKSDFTKIAENLQAALTTAPLQGDFNKKYSSLLYIDLRFGNKVYYKFK